jgi:FkbM family methyltransferase
MLGSPERFVLRGGDFHFQVDCLDEDVAMRVALDSTYESVVGALFLERVGKGDCVIDVGANKGYYTLVACKKVGPTGRVLAYEPEPRNLADIIASKEANGFDNLFVSAKALADKAGEASFVNDGWKEKNSAWGKLVEPGEQRSDVVVVTTCALDDELESQNIAKVDMLKLDIQGGEFAAIDGMRKSLQTHAIRRMLLELHDMQLSKDQCDYILKRIHEAGYHGRCYGQDEFTVEESLAAINGRKRLELGGHGMATTDYDYDKRGAPGVYRKPLQFLFEVA